MDKLKNMWDERYASSDYAYGSMPNKFFEETLQKNDIKGKILLPGEGEGRNAVYAARQGLTVTAFDISSEGKKKAMELANQHNVRIHYEVGELPNLNLLLNTFDAAALIYAHFPVHIRSEYHKLISELIKPNGWLIIEGFSEGHQNYQAKNPDAGGPKNKDMLYTKKMVANDFSDFEPILLSEEEIPLDEGKYHQGLAKVIRFIGRKID